MEISRLWSNYVSNTELQAVSAQGTQYVQAESAVPHPQGGICELYFFECMFCWCFFVFFSPVAEYVITYLVANNLACMIAFLKLYTSRL